MRLATLMLFVLVLPGSRTARADAFLYRNGTFQTINPPGAIRSSHCFYGTGPSETCAEATGINNLGQVVGNFRDARGTQGFLYSDGVFTTLDDLALGINDAGHILGGSGVYADGSFTHYENLPPNPTLTGITNWDEIVGFWEDACHLCQGSFTYMNGVVIDFDLQVPDPGGWGYIRVPTYALGINNAGKITGYAFIPDPLDSSNFQRVAFISDGGTSTTFDIPGAMGHQFGINDLDQVVGSFQDSRLRAHGFLFADNRVTTIDYPGADWTEARGINNAGDIVGRFRSAAFIPEPGSFLLFGSGVFAFGFAARRGRLVRHSGNSR